MMLRIKILIIFLLLHSVTGVGQIRSDRVALDSLIAARGQAEVFIKYPGFEVLTEIGRQLSVSGVSDGLASIVLAQGDVDYFVSLDIPFYIYPQHDSKAVLSASTVAEAMNWDKYPSYQQYDSIMHMFADNFPQICRLDTIGASYQGRQILVLKISDNVSVDEAEPEVFYTSTMHGDELAGYVLMLRLAEHLLNNYTPGSLEESLIDSLEIWINPLANPDGTYRDADLPGTRDTIYNPTRVNGNGTDLNRSFPLPIANEAPDNETFSFIDFQAERKFILSMNFHSGYEVVNYPWDTWLNERHADDLWFESISRAYADTVQFASGTSYFTYQNNGIVRGSVWYVIDGGRQDYITYAQQGREVTVELDFTKQTPGAQLPLMWQYNFRSLLRYLENAIFGIQGLVTDEDTGMPVPAKLFITGHDKDSSHIYSDTVSGRFVRLLYPGTYDLLFTAQGYNSKLIEGVTVADREQTWLNVNMKSTSQSIEDIDLNRLNIWPVPADDKINIQVPEGFVGEALIYIFSTSGSVYSLTERDIYSDQVINIRVPYLPGGLYICSVKSNKTGRTVTGSFIKR